MSVYNIITAKLTTALSPQYLDVIDESEKHHGHAGWREGGETHFRVRIATRHFDGLGRIAQHRRVMEVLDSELKSDIHALAIEIVGPDGPVKAPVLS